VGRALELDRIVAALRGPLPVAFVLAGEAGVGKTRLAAEAANAAAGLGYRTAHVACTRAAAAIPFGPFAPLLPVSDVAPEDLTGLLRQAADAIAGGGDRERRLLLVVDDAHLLDDGSAALVHQLVHSGSCSLVAGVRTPGPSPEPITALWKDGLADRLDLAPLTETDLEALVIAMLGGPAAGATVRRLFEMSRGNALYLRELINGGLETGALADDNGMWTLRGAITAPDRLVELVGARLSGLAPETVAVIELLAVAEPLSLSMLEQMVPPQAIEEAEGFGFLEVRPDGRRMNARLTHPVYGEVLRQRLPRSRLRRLSATLAEDLSGTGARRREDLLRVARWQLDAGGRGDPELLGRAARLSRQMFDLQLAARLARAALESGGGVDTGLVLGEAEFRSGRHEEAERVLAGLVPLCATDMETAQVAHARAYNLGVLMADSAGAAAVLEEALSAVTDVGARLRLLASSASKRVFEADPEAALAAAEELLSSSDDLTVGRGTYVASIASALLGRGDDAVEIARRGLEANRRTPEGNHQLPEVQLVGAVLGHAAAGRLSDSEAEATTGYQACLEAGDQEGIATFSLLRGWARVAEGQLGAAARAFLEGAIINREIRDGGALRWCLGGLALAEGMAGNAEPARSAVAELDSLPPTWMAIFEADLIDRGRAWSKVASGELSGARHLLASAAARAAATRQWVAEAHLLHDIARLGDAASVANRLEALAELTGNNVMAVYARHARALAEGSGSKLEVVSLAYEAFGAALLAAEARSAAAAAFRAEGLARKAAACEKRAAELVASCGGVHTPGLVEGGPMARLTLREREVAMLAASGVPSKVIAARLFVSARTVDNHLQAVYTKLGVTSRDELAASLGTP
jgi:DNA-binding CsgD family transcriptional regulator